MGRGSGNNESFAESLSRAAEQPDFGGGANTALPQLFGDFPIPTHEKIIDDLPHPDAVKGVPAYNFTAHFKRFIMGQVVSGQDHGSVEYTEQDDSAAYEALLNDILAGKAVLRFEERSTLKDGTFVVSMCYLVPKKTARSAE